MKAILFFLVISITSHVLALPRTVPANENYKEEFLDQYVDHFNYLASPGANARYKQRYLTSDVYWDKTSGPILFYTGNEGDITSFWNNTGFVFALAKHFKGLIVFGEHRYYGESLPFGEDSFKGNNIGYLSIEQALADFAVLIEHIKKEYDAANRTVFAFGGSYGGMLTAYMRYKYPHLIDGGVASSAPFLTVAGNRPRSEFFQSVTNTFHKTDPTCPASVNAGFAELLHLFKSGTEGLNRIEKVFNLCPDQMKKQNLEQNVIAWARNAFTLLAMVDYPYPANFLADLPGYPVKLACSYMKGGDKLAALANITDLLYGTKNPCHDTFTEYVYCSDPTGCGTGPDAPPWDYQACTELLLPGGSNNKTDMFPVLDFTLDMRRHYCTGKFGLGFSRLDWLETEYFGSFEDIKKTSRLIFPNGDLDPWMSGGVLKDLSDSLIAIIIKGGAHHLDLRASNPKDPQSVIDARERIISILAKWLADPPSK